MPGIAADGVRREGGSERPLGPKAARTRLRLLAAAYEVFSERGYQATSVAAVAERARVSLGTFYQYFRDRADVMGTIVRIGSGAVLEASPRSWDPRRGRLGLRRMIAGFVENYAASASFQAVWEEVTHVDGDMAALRRDLTRLFTAAVERALADGMESGLVRADLEPGAMATALTAMVDRFCYVTFVFDPPPAGPPSVDDAVDLLTALWADAIGLVEARGKAKIKR